MTTSDVRERIDRAIYDAWNLERGYEIPYLSPEAREAVIDALLAAFPWLADEPTDAEVEAAARALNAEGWTCYQGRDEPGNYDECEDCRRVCAGPARTVLAAAREARTT